MGKLIIEQAYILKKQPFREVFERETEGLIGMSWLSLILIVGGLGIHSTFFSCRNIFYFFRYMAS